MFIFFSGAHTLGRAHTSASGFQNKWVDAEFNFDNAFYKDILDIGLNWTLVNIFNLLKM